MTRVEAVFRKEVKEIWTNRPLVYSFLGLIFFLVIIPAGLMLFLQLNMQMVEDDRDISRAMSQLRQVVPGLDEVTTSEQGAIMVIRHFSLIFLILPVIGALGSSTSSIVGEKQSRSIEPVLATPVSTLELLVGKSLGTLCLALFGTWGGFLLYFGLVWLIGGTTIVLYSFDLSTLIAIGLLAPLIGLLGLGSGVVISSRVKDSRSAQQIGGLLVLPIVFLVVGQVIGFFILGPGFMILAAFGILVLDVLVLMLGVRIFNRERVLTEWK